MADYTYQRDQDGPPIGFRWLDFTRQALDFTSGWSFQMLLVTYTGVTQATVANASITGSNGAVGQPNVVIDWPAGFFVNVPVDQYLLHLRATQASSGKSRLFSLDRLPTLEVRPTPTAGS